VTNPSDHQAPGLHPVAPRWTREQIRDARLAPLVPLLEKRGLHLVETGGGNFLVAAFPGLIVKDSYWRWPARDLGANCYRFFSDRKFSRIGVVGFSRVRPDWRRILSPNCRALIVGL